MNIDAFEHLYRILQNIEDGQLPFTLIDWSENQSKGWGPWKRGCGTAFCVMGWAGQDPWFIEQGFQLRGTDDGRHMVVYDDHTEWDAVTAFLGITEPEAFFLLDGGNYGRDISPLEVALRIRAFVRNKMRQAIPLTETTLVR